MKRRLIVLLLSAVPGLAAAADRNPAALSSYQVTALQTAGVAAPPADALAIAAILVDRRFESDIAEQSFADRLVESWTSLVFASDKYGQPYDVANARCLASAQSNARARAPVLQQKSRDFAVLVTAIHVAQRYTLAELVTVKAFVATSAGEKTALRAFAGEPPGDDPRWKPVGDELNTLIDRHRRRFIDETRTLPRAKPLLATPPLSGTAP